VTGLEVLEAGPLTTVQDLGRPGLAELGVPRSGAADRGSLRLANRLVGNPEGAAALEVTLGGLVVRAAGALTVAITGADCPVLRDGRTVSRNAVVELPDGAVLALGWAGTGLRGYLAVRGGLAVPPLLGSRSTDTLAGLGPDRVAAGDRLPAGPAPDGWPVVEHAPVPEPVAGAVQLRVVPGPRHELVPGAADLLALHWQVGAAADRVGLRLEPADGVALPATGGVGSLRSEGLVPGSLQVPPAGDPVLFLADAPTTGGYPVVAVLLDADLDRAGQLRPGQRLTFRTLPPPDY
jgi:biotin-dependent carboxylase-like uncharacterized protein